MRIRSSRRVYYSILLALFIASSGLYAQGESRVKVHKELIAISGPDGEGRVQLTGQPGAIESTSAVEMLLLNLSTNERSPLLIRPDGSFADTVVALPNQKIRIIARNAEKKQSYGTFTVPAAPTAVEVAPVVPTPVRTEDFVQPALNTLSTPGLERPVVIAPTRTLSDDEATLPVAVYVNVVDQRTGQLLAAQRIEGTIYRYRLADAGYGEAVTRLMERFTVWVQRELHHVQITPTKASSATHQRPTTDRSPETHGEHADSHDHGDKDQTQRGAPMGSMNDTAGEADIQQSEGNGA